jgi:FlaG/FlaF family flagellin (archaellin)
MSWGRKRSESVTDRRGVSAAVGIVLMITVVVVLAAMAGSILVGLGEETPGNTDRAAVDIDNTDTGLKLTPEAVDLNAGNDIGVKINGELVRIYENFSVGQSARLNCLSPGDRVDIVSVSDGSNSQQAIAHHESYNVGSYTNCEFVTDLGGTQQAITPVEWGDRSSAESFYSFGRADGTNHWHSHMPYEFVSPDTTYMFFIEYDDEVSLVVTHDKPGEHGGHCDLAVIDGCTYESDHDPGGEIDMTFEGLPEDGSWTVRDDNPGNDNYNCGSGGSDTQKICWRWHGNNGDGGVYSGGFSGDLSDVSLTVSVGDHTEDVKFITGNKEVIDVDEDQPFTINGTAGGETGS